MVSVEIALAARAAFAECPTWDAASGTVLWVDLGRCAVHRYRPADGTDVSTTFSQPVAAAKPRAHQGLVLSLRDGVAVTEPDGSLRWLVDWSEHGVRGNDAGVDGEGRLWVGTIASESSPGWLARVSSDGALDVAAADVRMSNGIAWSPDMTRMYYVDTPTRRIDVFDYHAVTGRAVNRRVFAARRTRSQGRRGGGAAHGQPLKGGALPGNSVARARHGTGA